MDKKKLLPVVDSKNEPRPASRGVSRRQVAQWLAGGAGAVAAIPALAARHPVHAHLANDATMAAAEKKTKQANWQPEFLSPHQNETLIILAERILPGSTKADVNRFIDLLLSVDTRESQQQFVNSLSAFDGLAITRFQHPFKALTEAQQNEILTETSTAQRGQSTQAGMWGRLPTEGDHATIRDHFENVKEWVKGAYFSSEIGMKELGWTGDVMFSAFPGCEHPGGHS